MKTYILNMNSLNKALSLLLLLLLFLLMFDSGFASEPLKVACIGDSITFGVGHSKNGPTYPQALQEKLGEGYQVVNFGVSGKTALKHGKDNGGTPSAYIDMQEFTYSKLFLPDFVILMLGTNDSKPINWDNHAGEFEDDYIELVNSYKNLRSKPVVILATSPSVITDRFNITEKTVAGEIVPLERKLAEKTGCIHVDIYSLTQNQQPWSADGVHYNSEGYVHFASAFADIINSITRQPYTNSPVIEIIDQVNDKRDGYSSFRGLGCGMNAVKLVTVLNKETVQDYIYMNYGCPKGPGTYYNCLFYFYGTAGESTGLNFGQRPQEQASVSTVGKDNEHIWFERPIVFSDSDKGIFRIGTGITKDNKAILFWQLQRPEGITIRENGTFTGNLDLPIDAAISADGLATTIQCREFLEQENEKVLYPRNKLNSLDISWKDHNLNLLFPDSPNAKMTLNKNKDPNTCALKLELYWQAPEIRIIWDIHKR